MNIMITRKRKILKRLMPNDMRMKCLRRNKRYHENLQLVSKYFFSFVIIILSVFSLSGCAAAKYSSYNPQNKIAPEKLRADLVVLKKVLEANHPSLYWYTPKDSVDAYFNEALKSINDSLTEFQFRAKVAWFIEKLRCGHTSVRASKGYQYYFSKNESNKFPLLLKSWNDSLVVLASLKTNDTIFKRGVVVNSIDGRSNRSTLDSMFQFISTDGYADNFKNQAISFNFPLYYSLAFPVKDSFLINYTDTTGAQKTTYIKLYKPSVDTARVVDLQGFREATHKERKEIELLDKRNINYDTLNHTAYMRVATFDGGKLRSFFKQSFTALKNKNINNLIIDLRENTGGNISMSNNLTRYIKDTPFHVADTAAAISRSLPYGKYIHPSLFYRIVMRFTTRKESDGRFHFREIEKRKFKPYHDLHFDGNVYIVQGGYTFSAAAMFVLSVKGQHNVTVTGEETGGGNYGTTAVHLPSIVLPNSKIRVTLPLYRVVPDAAETKTGKGIQPDIYIPPSSVAIKNGVDPKIQKIKELIQVNVKKQAMK
jgi:hypothetical protein